MEPTTSVASDRQPSPKSKKGEPHVWQYNRLKADIVGIVLRTATKVKDATVLMQQLQLRNFVPTAEKKKRVFHGFVCRMSLQVRIMHQVL